MSLDETDGAKKISSGPCENGKAEGNAPQHNGGAADGNGRPA